MADALRFSSSSSYNLKINTNFQLIIYILLHDLSLICSFITSYPLYFSYFLFFSRYIIKLFSFISPLFISAVVLSLLLTTTTAFCPKLPQLELGILQSVIQKLKSNLCEVNGDEEDRNFEDFEIYKIVFDGAFTSAICNAGGEEMHLTKKILERSVYGGWRNDVRTSFSDLDELCIDKISEYSLRGGRRNDDSISDSDSDTLGFGKTPENSVHGGRRNDDPVSDSDSDKLGFEIISENSVHGCRRNYVSTDNLGAQKIPESPVNGSRRSDASISDSDSYKSCVKKCLENSVYGGRRIDFKLGVKNSPENSVNCSRRIEFTVTDSYVDESGIEKISENPVHGGRRLTESTITDSHVNELEKEKGLEKLLEELDRFEDFTPAIETNTDSGDENKYSKNSVRSSSWRSNCLKSVNSYGSMREEKEWRRTLACKLFEERHNSGGGEEGMDSLWEAHENNNNGGIKRFIDDEEEDDEEDEDEMSNGHLCCLQALKLSTRKMNLGMGKSNFVKISKALKGFGWLHHVKKNKHRN